MAEKKEKEEKHSGYSSQEGLGVAGFVFSILSIVMAGGIGLMLGILGLIFCIVQQKKHPMKLSKIGIFLSVAGIIISIVVIVYYAKQILPVVQQQLQAGGQ